MQAQNPNSAASGGGDYGGLDRGTQLLTVQMCAVPRPASLAPSETTSSFWHKSNLKDETTVHN